MSHVITSGDIIHWGLFAAFIGFLAASAVVWLYALGSAMSDTPGEGPPSIVLYGMPLLALVTFVVWCIV